MRLILLIKNTLVLLEQSKKIIMLLFFFFILYLAPQGASPNPNAQQAYIQPIDSPASFPAFMIWPSGLWNIFVTKKLVEMPGTSFSCIHLRLLTRVLFFSSNNLTDGACSSYSLKMLLVNYHLAVYCSTIVNFTVWYVWIGYHW